MQSSDYPLNLAHDICLREKRYPELVYVLGRMGNTEEALRVLINVMEDVKQVRSL
jgi:hypothetical protein